MPRTKTRRVKSLAGAPLSISQLRSRLDLTQQGFATLLGLSTVSVSRWEHNRTAPTDASLAVLGLLERALKKRKAKDVVDALRGIAAENELERVITLVHLGDA